MKNGFLHNSETLRKAPPSLVPRCGACGLYKSCSSPKMAVDGEGKRKILLVGEAPGKEEDREGRPFVGPSGKLLEGFLADYGVDMRRDCWITNSAICRPPNNKYPDKTVDWCRPTVIESINRLQPEVIIPLGGRAVQSVIGWLWKQEPGPVGRWVGWQIPSQQLNAWVCPVWHPMALEYERERGRGAEVFEVLLRKHLAAACSLAGDGRPYDKVPSYGNRVRVLINPDEAGGYLSDLRKSMTHSGKPLAFDFETDRLKPDHPASQVVCCAVSDGSASLAYVWHGSAVQETRSLLMSGIPKIGYNLKFEDRWFRKLFGCGVRNWVWDGMLAAHVLDNRPAITSLKFQAFARLGFPLWNQHVEPFLHADGSNDLNRIREVDLRELLYYCGLDALLEWKIARKQMKELGYDDSRASSHE